MYENQNDQTPAPWEPPIPFDEVTPEPFPLELLPPPVADFTAALAESTQTPTEMAGVLALGVLAAVFQDKFTLRVTPDWTEPLALFTVAVANPGERKSAVLSALTKPLADYEAYRREAEKVEVAQCKAERALLEKQLAAAQTAASKPGAKADEARREVLDLAGQLELFRDKQPYRLLVDDSTPEKLAAMLEQQGGSLAVCSAEGGVFDIMAGRYDKNANLDVYLKGHAGDPLTVDRVGREANHVASPHLTMILTVQPSVLSGLMSNPSFRGRGLCGRFLYAVCSSKVGHRKVDPEPVPLAVRAAYNEFLMEKLTQPWRGELTLDEGADYMRTEYMKMVELRLIGAWDGFVDWGSKAVGAALRVAALLHAAQTPGDPTAVPINIDTMTHAGVLIENLAPHTMAAYQSMGADDETENAKYLWKRIYNLGKGVLTKSEIIQLTRGRFKRAADLDEPLKRLLENGYLRSQTVETGGRASEQFLVNTLALLAKPGDKKAAATPP
jgi:hypothetical protein